ncbi:hypothetical protein [Neisseria sp. P0008.S004]|uniref:hypothetical protein n=1 Tax=Neisseria sp. P0008.S004 TaxID=3436701 RepID=UPI003F7D327E
MSEPLVTPVAMYTLGGTVAAGHFLGMPIDAVVLGAMASAAVTMVSAPQSRWMAVSYTVIGGLLGGALAPVLVHIVLGKAAAGMPELAEQKTPLAHVAAPVMVGLCWQLVLKVMRVLWPSFEKHADEIVDWILSVRLTRRKKK